MARIEIRDLKAALDQIQAALRDIAPVIYTHYSSLREAGFDSDQAFILTRDFHSHYLYPQELEDEGKDDDSFPD